MTIEFEACAGCKRSVDKLWVESILWENKTLPGTGQWISNLENGLCEICLQSEAKKDAANVDVLIKEKNLSDAGFFNKHLNMSFANFEVTTPSQNKLRNQMTTDGNFFLYGPRGVGKTHLAVSFLKHRLSLGHRIAFRNVPRLLMDLRQQSQLGNDAAVIDTLLSYGGLALDDLGVEKPSEWVLQILYLIVDGWDLKDKKGLVVTSNYSLDEISARLNDRIASRVAGMCKVYKMEGRDRRIAC